MNEPKECTQCGAEATIKYDYEEIGQKPSYCPFCGSSYIDLDADDGDIDLLKDDGYADDLDFSW